MQENKKDIRGEIGYRQNDRPTLPNYKEVMSKREKRQPQESPLKEWWKEKDKNK